MKLKHTLICATVPAFLISCGSPGLSDIRELGQYEGTYQLVGTNYPRCAEHKFVEVSYDPEARYLSVEPRDEQQRYHGWQWLEFGPLNDGPQDGNIMFVMTEHYKYVANKTDNGWQAQKLRKDCQLKMFCSRWLSQELISFTDQVFQLELLQDTERCTYRRLSGNG